MTSADANERTPSVDEVRRFAFMREEVRFEIGLLHDRINALISAEAFLTIAFTMSMNNGMERFGGSITTLVPPILSSIGLILALFAWPGVDASLRIIREWDARHRTIMRDYPYLGELMWRASTNQRHSMLFARAVPAVFGIAWAVLTAIAFVAGSRR